MTVTANASALGLYISGKFGYFCTLLDTTDFGITAIYKIGRFIRSCDRPNIIVCLEKPALWYSKAIEREKATAIWYKHLERLPSVVVTAGVDLIGSIAAPARISKPSELVSILTDETSKTPSFQQQVTGRECARRAVLSGKKALTKLSLYVKGYPNGGIHSDKCARID